MNNSQKAGISVVLADMAMETHGGVADTIANLANNLRYYSVSPIVILHNPVPDDHPYVRFMRKQGVMVWAVSERQSAFGVAIFHLLAFLLWPLVIMDAMLRRKPLAASRQSIWGVLRRVGYGGLRAVFYLRLARARTVHRSKVVHFFKPDMWPALWLMKLFSFKTLYTEGTDPLKETPYYYAGLCRHKVYIDGVTAVSGASAHGIQAMLGESYYARVIPNMVDIESLPPGARLVHTHTRRDCCTVGLIGRLSPQKDIGTFLQACQRVLVQFPNVHCEIHGDGPERERLTGLCNRLGIEHAVRFTGAFAKERLPEILAGLDIVVLSSVYEGFGISLLEAMAYSIPVAATSVGGVPEVVEDDVTGLLVSPQSPELLADAICRLIAEPDLRRRMGEAGRRRYEEHFAPESVVPQYVEIYHALVHGASNS